LPVDESTGLPEQIPTSLPEVVFELPEISIKLPEVTKEKEVLLKHPLRDSLEWRSEEDIDSPLMDFSEVVRHNESEHEGFDR
jgi:hypothetical protein